MKDESGFSLTDTCVIVCLLSLTLLLALPLWAGYQVDAETTGCRSNLRALSFALHAYARDHNGWMPAWQEFEVAVRSSEYSGSPMGFTYHVLKIHDSGYIDEPALWKCPSDHWNGPGASIPVFIADSFESPPFHSVRNVSYLYVAGYNIRTTSENPALVPVLADESNEVENGTATPGMMPPLTPNCNHGESYRNVLYLGGQIAALADADSANAIFDAFSQPSILQVVD